jgi:SNF2 family DNA or RNA helicase
MSTTPSLANIFGNVERTTSPTPAAAAPTSVPVLSPEVPVLALPLMPFQHVGVMRVLHLRRALLADEMGLGKTPQGIAVASAAVRDGVGPVLVVCPPSLRTNWRREFSRFAPHLSVATLVGTKPSTVPTADVIIAGDSQVAGWAEALAGQVRSLIVDEAHRLKNYRAKRTIGVQTIAAAVPADGFVVLMSGTPIVNHPVELASPLQILDGLGKLGFRSVRSFLDFFAPVEDRWGGRGVRRLDDLNARLREHLMVRRLRRDVLDLPAKGRAAVALDMDAASRRRYAAAEDDLRSFLLEERGQLAANAAMRAEAIVRLNTLRRLAGLGKVPAVVEQVRDLLDEGEQVLIAAWHTPVVEALIAALSPHTSVVRITGGMSDKAKTASVDSFQSGEARVLVGNIVAAGVGFTLTSGRHVVFAELPWTPGDLQQMEDRLHRIGQEREVVVTITLADTPDSVSIDAHVWSLLEAKADTVTMVLDGEEIDLLDDQSVVVSLLDLYRD